MKNTARSIFLPLLGAAALAGCSLSGGNDPPIPRDDPSKYRRNPAPKIKYEITARANNAPGPLQLTEGSIGFMVTNCKYVIDEYAGVGGRPRVNFPAELKPVGGGVYKAYVYLDQMLDEDYWGQGVCKWMLGNVTAVFSVVKDRKATNFQGSIINRQIAAEDSTEDFYWKKSYHAAPEYGDPLSLPGQSGPEKFSIQMSSKKVN